MHPSQDQALKQQNRYEFLMQLLQATYKSKGNAQVVYPLLTANLDKLDDLLIAVLQDWAGSILSKVEVEEAQDIVTVVAEFGNLMLQFQQGDLSKNLTIAIISYEIALDTYRKTDLERGIPRALDCLGLAYFSKSQLGIDSVQNLQQAIDFYQEAIPIHHRLGLTSDLSQTLTNLGNAYNAQADLGIQPTDNLQKAIEVYQEAVEIRRQPGLEGNLSKTLDNLGIAYLSQAQLGFDPSVNLQLAVEAQREAVEIQRLLGLESELSNTLVNFGNTHLVQTRLGIEPTTNLQQAIDSYQEAAQIHLKLGLEQDIATTLTCLGNAYFTQAELGVESPDNLLKAIAAYQESARIRRQLGLKRDLSQTLDNLGNVYVTLAELGVDTVNNLTQAIDTYQQVAHLRRQLDLERDFAQTLSKLGNAYGVYAELRIQPIKNIQQAVKIYTEAEQVLRQLNLQQDLAQILNNLGITYRIQAELGIETLESLQQAITKCSEATQILRQQDLKRDLAAALNSLGNAYRILADLGVESFDNLQQAIAIYLEATQICRELALESELALYLINLGSAYQDKAELGIEPADNLRRVINTYIEASQIFRKLGLERNLAGSLNNLGIAHSIQAELEIEAPENLKWAVQVYKEAANIRQKLNLEREFANTLNNLGNAYLNQADLGIEPIDNLKQAIETYTVVTQILREIDLERDLATTLNNMANAYSGMAKVGDEPNTNLQRAIDFYQQSAQIRRQLGLERDLSATLNNLGNTYVSQADQGIEPVLNRQEAVKCYRAALQTFTPDTLPAECIKTGRLLGNLGFTQKWWEIAIEGYTRAIAAVEQTRFWSIAESRKKEVTEGAIQVYRNIVQTYIQLQQYDKALEYVDRSKTRNLVELLATRDLIPKGDISSDTLQYLQTLRQQLLIAERRLNPDPEQVSTLRQELDSYIQTHIQPFDPSFSLTQKVEPIDFATMREMLPDDRTALVAWYVMGDCVLSFIVTRQTSQPHLIELATESHQALIELVNQYLNSYTQDKTAWKAELPDFLQQLATLLNLTALLRHIPDPCDQLILIPHVFLHLLPLHALLVEDTKEKSYLIDRFPRGLHYAPSIQLLQLSQTWSRPSLQRFFCVENPTEDLSFTNLEVATIRTYFHPYDYVLERQQAHKTALNSERLAQTNVAHFSCHGYFNFKTPSQSALLLAGSKAPTTMISADKTRFWASRDGGAIDLEQCLTLGDIFALDLRQCRLTTLSACETGLTDFKSLGDEYIGLPSGFLYAGSPSVVSSLWTVDDLSTAFLTIKFYEHLQDFEQYPSVAIALNQAQLWLRNLTQKELQEWILRKKISLDATVKMNLRRWLHQMPDDAQPFQSPFYWAAFCAIGQ